MRKTKTFQHLQRPLNRYMHLALFRRAAQVSITERPRILLALLLREREHDDGEQLKLAQMPNEVHPEVPILLLEAAWT